MQAVGFTLAIALALVHGFIAQLEVEAFIPKHRWLSFAGEGSMDYVFLDIFPELSHAQSFEVDLLVHSIKLKKLEKLEKLSTAFSCPWG